MTAPCPGSSSFHPDQHDPLCDLPIHAVESPVLLHKQSNTSGLALPRTDLMDDITSQQVLTYKEANRDERQQKTLAGGASNVFPSFSVNSFTRPSGPGQHKGNHSEVHQPMLASFSILPQQSRFPVTAHAGMRRMIVEGAGAGQEEVDGSKSSIAVVVVDDLLSPSRYDILFGRGRKVMEHPGNLRLLSLVKDKTPFYDAASKEAKTRLTVEVVQILKCRLSRFLKKNASGVWEEVTDALARKKVSHAFRTMRQSAARKQEKHTTQGQATARPDSGIVQDSTK